jgi:hypothetical protein
MTTRERYIAMTVWLVVSLPFLLLAFWFGSAHEYTLMDYLSLFLPIDLFTPFDILLYVWKLLIILIPAVVAIDAVRSWVRSDVSTNK